MGPAERAGERPWAGLDGSPGICRATPPVGVWARLPWFCRAGGTVGRQSGRIALFIGASFSGAVAGAAHDRSSCVAFPCIARRAHCAP